MTMYATRKIYTTHVITRSLHYSEGTREIFLWGHRGHPSLFHDFKVALPPPFPSMLKLMTELFLSKDSSGPERTPHRDV